MFTYRWIFGPIVWVGCAAGWAQSLTSQGPVRWSIMVLGHASREELRIELAALVDGRVVSERFQVRHSRDQLWSNAIVVKNFRVLNHPQRPRIFANVFLNPHRPHGFKAMQLFDGDIFGRIPSTLHVQWIHAVPELAAVFEEPSPCNAVVTPDYSKITAEISGQSRRPSVWD